MFPQLHLRLGLCLLPSGWGDIPYENLLRSLTIIIGVVEPYEIAPPNHKTSLPLVLFFSSFKWRPTQFSLLLTLGASSGCCEAQNFIKTSWHVRTIGPLWVVPGTFWTLPFPQELCCGNWAFLAFLWLSKCGAKISWQAPCFRLKWWQWSWLYRSFPLHIPSHPFPFHLPLFRVTFQSWTTRSSVISSHHRWRTRGTCYLEICRIYLNFTTGRQLALCTEHSMKLSVCLNLCVCEWRPSSTTSAPTGVVAFLSWVLFSVSSHVRNKFDVAHKIWMRKQVDTANRARPSTHLPRWFIICLHRCFHHFCESDWGAETSPGPHIHLKRQNLCTLHTSTHANNPRSAIHCHC